MLECEVQNIPKDTFVVIPTPAGTLSQQSAVLGNFTAATPLWQLMVGNPQGWCDHFVNNNWPGQAIEFQPLCS